MRALLITAVAFAGTGCVEAGTTTCADGRVCPAGTVCDEIHAGCVLPDQLETCLPLQPGDACLIGGQSPGRCLDGVCVRQGCGDGIALELEECDLADLRGAVDCLDLDYYESGPISCDDECRVDVSQCTGTCGDGEVHATKEFCDGAPPALDTCPDFGYDVGRLDCTLFCTPAFDDCKHLEWRNVALGEPWTFWTGGPDLIFGVGDGGLIMRFDGDAWETMTSGTTALLTGVWGSGPADVWAVGEGPTLLHYDGSAWTEETAPTAEHLYAIWGAATDDVFAVGGGGTILHWNGSAWSEMTSPTDLRLVEVWGVDGGTVFAGGDGPFLRYSGGDWTAIGGGQPYTVQAIWGSSASDVWIAGGAGGICYLRHWNGTSLDPRVRCPGDGPDIDDIDDGIGHVFDLWGSGPDDVYAAGWQGVFMHWDGTAWTRLAAPTGIYMRAVGGSGPGDVYASSFTGIWHSSGATWTLMGQEPPDQTPAVIWGRATDDVWAFGATEVLHWDGDNWTSTPAPVSGPMRAILGFGPGDAIAVGDGASVAKLTGNTWSQLIIPTPLCDTCNLRTLGGTSATDVFIGTGDGRILHYDGSFSLSANIGTSGIHAFGPGDVYATVRGPPGGVMHYDGDQWTESIAPIDDVIFHDLAGTSDRLFTTTSLGQLHEYAGGSWTVLPGTVPVYGSGPRLLVLADDDVFVKAVTTSNDADIVHWDGTQVTQVGFEPGPVGAWSGTRRRMWFTAAATVHELLRTVPWSCRAAETDCADGVDDDCDGAIDGADDDC